MQFLCLGPLRVVRDGQQVRLGGPKQRLVLATLLLHANEEITADALVEAVWDGDAPASGRNSLHTYVSHLRKAVGAGRIERRSQSYRLHADSNEIDSARFEELVHRARRLRPTDPDAAAAALREALALWSGPPFADLSEAPSLQGEIARLDQLRLTAIEERFSVDLDRGLSAELVADLEALVAAHPLRERLWAALMLALYRAGRQGDALAAYDRARAVLVDELGVDPSPELRQLQERILQQDRALEPGAPALKGYRLVERLRDDAGWTTWRAAQPGVDREVAIRAARPELANSPSFIRSFDLRAQRLARIEHPHVLPIYDFWREPDGAYVVTRLVTGGDVGRLLDGPVERTTRQRVADQLLRAVAAAHRGGVVHGRLRPGAVALDEQDNVALSDFAVAEGDVEPLSADGDARFLAPELADGEPPDTRADVFSLGVLLSELLDGHGNGMGQALARAVATDPTDRPADAQELLSDLRALSVGAMENPVDATTGPVDLVAGPARNPYKGLQAFTEADSEDFFGRREVVARLLTALRDPDERRFLGLVGPSGSGKSSVVRAGLVPALRGGAVPGSADWYVVQMVPGTTPFEELAAALRRVAVDPPTHLADALAGPAGIVGTVTDALPDDSDLLLVIDQFEELFTLVAPALRRRFVDALVAAVNDEAARVRVLVTLRADFYDRPLAEPALAELMQAHTQTIVPMSAVELSAAVTAPAEQVGVRVEGPLVAQMIGEVADQPGALPLLQYALTELFDARTEGVLSLDAYRRIGGLTAALARRADNVYLGLPEVARAAGHQLFLRLVTPGEGAEDTRRRATTAEVTALAPPHMATVLAAFGDARLLSFDRDPETREPTVEVAHEALLREWPRLRRWIDAARDDLRTHRRLHAAAADWATAGRDTSFLATGSRLEQYEAWRASSGMTTSDLEGAYLDASIEHRDRSRAEETARRERERALERRSVRRLRVLVSVLGAAAVIAGTLTVLAVTQAGRAAEQAEVAAEQAQIAEEQATVATVRELSAEAVANLDVDVERSLLLALEAVGRARTDDGTVLPEAEEALHRAVTSSRIALRVPEIGGRVAWSPLGGEFVTEGPEETGLVDIRDAVTGATVRSWKGHDIDINDVAYSPDGSVLVTAGDDGAVRAWNPMTGEELGSYSTLAGDADEFVPESDVWGPSVSPDNSLMAAAWPRQGVARVIDIASGERVHEIDMRERTDTTAFHPDGDLFAVSQTASPGRAAVFDVASGEEVWAIEVENGIWGHSFSPDGQWLATFGPPADVRLFDARTGEPAGSLAGHDGPVLEMTWSTDGKRLATGSQDGTAKVWEVVDGQVREVLSLSSLDTTDAVVGVAFSPDAERLLVGPGLVTAALVFDISLSGDAEWANLPAAVRTFSLEALSDDRVIASGPDAAATMWNARTGERVRRFDPGAEPVRHLAATADGAYLAGETWDGPVHVWDIETGDRLWTVGDEAAPLPAHLDFADNPYRLAIQDEDAVTRIYDESGDLVKTLEEGVERSGGSVGFSPDGAVLATGSGAADRNTEDASYVVMWDVDEGRALHRLPAGLQSPAFSPDGRHVMVPDAGVGEIFDATDGSAVATLVGHRGFVAGSDYSPDGSRIATPSGDGTVRLWDATTGTHRMTLHAHGSSVHSAVFSPDGSMLITADNEGVVRSWATDIDDLVAIAEEELTRDFTDEECRQFLDVEACPAD